MKKSKPIRLLLIRMFNTMFVGTGVLDGPRHIIFGRDVVFSADLCYNGTNGKAPSRREAWDALNNRGMGFALCLCNTKAKPAIKRNGKYNFSNWAIECHRLIF